MATVSGFTAISRVLGFLRDMLIVQYLGAGMVSDAFFSAFRFPNLFRRVFGEGAFNSAFVPLFARELEESGKPQALQFASRTFTILALFLGVGTLIGLPLMALIMSAVVPGFKAADTSPAMNVGETHEFRVNVKGARKVFFVLEGGAEDALGQVTEGVLSATSKSGGILAWYQQSVSKLMGESTAVAEDLALSALIAGPAKMLAGKGDDLLEVTLPKDHQFTELTGMFRMERGERGSGAQMKTYRNHPGTFDLTVKLTQITFAYLMCMALVAHLSGVLNTVRIFGMPAAAPVFLNLVFLIGLLIVVPVMGWQKDPVACGYVAAVCVFVAGFVQLTALYVTCRMKGLPVRFIRPTITPRVKRLFMLMGPGVVSAGIQQINLLVGGIVASFQEGAVSYLYTSDRIYQLPLGMIGIALGVVLLPEITRRLRADDLPGAQNSMNRGLEIALLVTFPAAVAMLVIPYPIVSTLFERGEFKSFASEETSLALAGFALGLPGYVLIRVLQPGYFAQENTKSPMYMAGITVAVNIVFSLLLFPIFRHVGIAVATTISAWVNVFLLVRGLKGFLLVDQRLKRRLPRIFIASLLMGAALIGLHQLVGGWFTESTIMLKVAGLAILVFGGIATYAGCALALKATTLRDLKGGFKR
ncbi:MAG: putative peptidoglycan lipid II flippase [Verrucomicrobiales bacterium]|jgi:putative peptidoglycan lipid II flippase